MKRCCLCKDEIEGHGHNPVPLYNKEGRCCGVCNLTRVIPARLQLKNFRDGKDEKHFHSNEK
tara:strand:- start:317 stop:502 length:186 start_codon:yes stop_codon:yes gene_type:complete